MNKIIIILFLFSLKSNAQIITSVAGNGVAGYNSDSIPATNSEINQFEGIAIDAHNNLFIADPGNNRVRKVDAITGVITTIAGTGVAGFSGDGGMADTAKLNGPDFIAIDYIGNIYVWDYNNIRIRKIDTFGIITTYAGTGSSGGTGDGGQATAATFYAPNGIATDDTGNLYIDDVADYKIRKVSFSTGIISTVVGTGVSGFSGDGGLAATATINAVQDIYVDHLGNLYLPDQNNERVRKVTASTGIISTIAGMGAFAYTADGVAATLAPVDPRAMAVDNTGNVFISDYYNNRIRRVDAATGIITTYAGNGTYGFYGDGGLATNAEIKRTAHLTFDNCSNLYIADCYNYRVRKVTISATTPTFSIATTSGDTICIGSTVTIHSSITSSSTGTATYQWYVNGTLATSTAGSYSYAAAGGDSVRCVLTDITPCGDTFVVGSNTVHIVAETITTPTISLSGVSYATIYSVVTVNATVAGAGSSYSINWYNWGVWFATTTLPTVTYTKAMVMDSITARVVPVGVVCYDSVLSAVHVVGDSALSIASPRPSPKEREVLRVYPNPAGDVVNVAWGDVISEIVVSDVFGKVVYRSYELGVRSYELDVRGWVKGVYFVRVNGVGMGRFVKLSEL